jgi:hypothetical protein
MFLSQLHELLNAKPAVHIQCNKGTEKPLYSVHIRLYKKNFCRIYNLHKIICDKIFKSLGALHGERQ